MTANQLFKEILKDPILQQEPYNFSPDQLNELSLAGDSEEDILQVIKIIVSEMENGTPDKSINSRIRTHFKI